MPEQLILRDVLKGHAGWVTSLAIAKEKDDLLVSGSRDKSVMVWDLVRGAQQYGICKKSLHGHNHFVSDVVLSSNGQHALSSSWDKTVRIWDLTKGTSVLTLLGHEKDVLSVSLSPNNNHIVTASRDKTLKLWSAHGDEYNVFTEEGHSEWVSCVRFSPNPENPIVVSAGWDKVVKVWNASTGRLIVNHYGHNGYINNVAISPDGSLCASGGKDGITMLWDITDSKHLYSLKAGHEIHALTFSPNRYWLCAATSNGIKIWDLETKTLVDDLKPEHDGRGAGPYAVSLTWSADGQTLFAGYTDNVIRVWQVISA